ncbi:MAG: TonB-dependent receptor [Acidobacteria bacterium]|nr:TonB-dependent receptor [Acidobacteriota bacterium]
MNSDVRITKRVGGVLSGTLMPVLLSILLIVNMGGVVGAQQAQAATGTLRGAVSYAGPDGQAYNIPAASLKLTGTPQVAEAVANEAGEYEFSGLPPGAYTLEVNAQGFKTAGKPVTVRADETSVEDISLEVAEVSESVTVVSSGGQGIDATEAAPAAQLSRRTLQTVPLRNERFTDALPLVPGVVRGPDGQINVKGGRSSQSGMTVNSSNVTDPVTGEYAINLPVEAVESVRVITNPYAAEYGNFTAGVTEVETRSGADKWQLQFQNFFPRLRRNDGHVAGIESMTPRLAFGGPVVKGKLSFFQSFEYRFVRTPVESLPLAERDTKLESLDSYTRADWQIDPKNQLSTTFSLFPQKQGYVGLNTFNPQEVTPDFRQRGFFWAVNESRVMGGSSLLESRFSVKQFDTNVYPSSGGGVMNFAPDRNSGKFYNRQERNSRRYEAQEVYSFAPPALAGTHSLKAGVGFVRDNFDGESVSGTVRILRADGTRSQQIDYVGDGKLRRDKTAFSSFFEDKWTPNRRLTLDYGVRFDRDNVASENNVAPRLGVAYAPFADGRTVIRGGVGLFYDSVNLNVATFEQTQQRVLTSYAADGIQVLGTPVLQRLALDGGEMRTPRSVNWNVEVDGEWVKNLLVRVGYAQREARREFVVNPVEDQTGDGRVMLSNGGRASYKEFQVTARYRLRERDELVASYTRSKSEGDLNDFNSYYGNFRNPVIRPDERGPLPWDAPNRFLVWGDFGVKYGITVAPVLDIRSGFPLSNIDEDRNFVGGRDRAGRFPAFGSLDLQVLKSVSAPGRWGESYRLRLGAKVFNVTNHFNPRDYQGNLASEEFGGFYNGVGRRFGLKFVIEKK